MHDTIAVAIVQGAGNLARELAGLLLLQFAVGDNVIQHLAPIDVFKKHVPVVCSAHHISHPANVRVIYEADNSGFSSGSNLLGAVCSLGFSAVAMFLRGEPWDDLDSNLRPELALSRSSN